MTKPNIILIGAGGHAHSCIDVIEQQGKYRIAGLVGLPDELHSSHLGYEVIAEDLDLPELAREYEYALITVGQIHSPVVRIQLYQKARQFGFVLPSIIAPTAYVSPHANVGAGTIVMHGAVLNAGGSVGDNCIINTRALVEHDVAVENHCHIATGALLNGGVRVGEGSLIGSGSVIKEGIVIGKNSLVGLGLCVRHNQADFSRFTGTAQ